MKWIVCFTPHSNRGTWRWFTFWRPQHQHVFATRYETSIKSWVFVECSSRQLNFEILKDDSATELIHYLTTECECVEIETKGAIVYLPRLLYCVSFIKHLVGVRNIFILTPYQLRCEFLKRRGNVIFQKDKENGSGIFKKQTKKAA